METDNAQRASLRSSSCSHTAPFQRHTLCAGDLQWVANTATLIYGDQDAVLVDTHTTIEQNAHLIEWVRSFDRNLTFLYLTHGHIDHVFGIRQLTEAFPAVRAVATAATVEETLVQSRPETFEALWDPMFPGQISKPPVAPFVLEGQTIVLEGHNLEVIEAGFTDTRGSTALWVPDLGLVVAGDIAYDDTHQYLLETTPSSRLEWVAAIEKLQALHPQNVVAGHKHPDHTDSPDILAETIAYLQDFDELVYRTDTNVALFTAMLERYPRRINPSVLWLAANQEKG